MVSYKRYEVLSPLRYNDGTPVEPEKFVETRRELLERFKGLTADFVPLTGYWIDPTDTVVEDQLVRLIVDVRYAGYPGLLRPMERETEGEVQPIGDMDHRDIGGHNLMERPTEVDRWASLTLCGS